MYKFVRYNNIKVSYLDHLDGGGRTFGQQFIPVVKEKIGRVNHIFEFCAGPGFIGFSLLANNLCEKLTLADINPEAIEICKDTIKNNKLESRVHVYTSDCLDNIPENEKWDLVVGNPPHWFCADKKAQEEDIRLFDHNFSIHQRFYQDIRKFLKPSGTVLLQENKKATSVDDFKKMIEVNGLKLKDVFTISPLHFTLYFNISLCHRIFNPREIIRHLEYHKFVNKHKIKHKLTPHFLTPFYFIWCN